ncbi:DUF3137 domain-containing protein [Oceanithermus sp.]
MALTADAPLPELEGVIRRSRALEVLRRSARAQVARTWLTFALVVAALYLARPLLGAAGWPVFFGSAFALFVWALMRSQAAARPYREAYRQEVLEPLVQAVLPGFRHDPEAGLPQEVFLTSRLFPTRPDRYASEDLFEGEVEGVPLRFAEVHAQEEREECDNDGCRTHYSTIFRGLFAVAEFPKAFTGTVLVYPDRSERWLGLLSRSLQRLGGRLRGLGLVKLEDPAFEERFVVYASDPITARYVLSTRLMAALRAFRDRHGELYAAVLDGTLYLAIPQRRDLFEPPPLWRSAVDVGRLRAYAEALRTMRAVVIELGLNVRVWGERALRGGSGPSEPEQ